MHTLVALVEEMAGRLKTKQYAKIPSALEKLVYAKRECFTTKRHNKQEVKN